MSNQVINAEANELTQSALITLFEMDVTSLVPANVNGIFRFHSGTVIRGANIVWQGNTYTQIPCEADGFEMRSQGVIPRPRIRFRNLNGEFSALTLAYDDLVGAKVSRKRTFYSRIDAINYPGGVNTNADPTAQVPDDIYYISRKLNENNLIVEFELVSPLDLEGKLLPGRVVTSHICRWKYRDGYCDMAEDYVFALSDDTLVPNKEGFIYLGLYHPANEYPQYAVVYVMFGDIKYYYYAHNTPDAGEHPDSGTNWTLDQVFAGAYDPDFDYHVGNTTYIVDSLGIRHYYYCLVRHIGITPPDATYWATDSCSLSTIGCGIRFNTDIRGLPFGGYPGTNLSSPFVNS